MAELKGSNTEKNLQTAFAGESQAFQKYTYYAAAARKAGMNEIADYFEETAHNESAHAKVWFKALHGGDISADIEANLRDAAAGENYEHTTMYKDFADEAEKEGFTAIAFKMREVGKIEARHEARYLALAARVSGNKVFQTINQLHGFALTAVTFTLVKKLLKFAQYVLTHKLSSNATLNPSNL